MIVKVVKYFKIKLQVKKLIAIRVNIVEFGQKVYIKQGVNIFNLC